MLHVELRVLIPRERNIQVGERSLLAVPQPFKLVQEVTCNVSIAEDEPVLAAVTMFAPVFNERPVWRDACARTNHNDWCVAISRQAELIVGFNVHGRVRRIADQEI